MSSECYIDKLMKEECHLETYNKSKILDKLTDVDEHDLDNLCFRVEGYEKILDHSICDYHVDRSINHNHVNYASCCNPLRTHKKGIISKLLTLHLEMCKQVKHEVMILL